MTELSHPKPERLLPFEQILAAYPEWLCRAEIARKMGVHRATIERYIEDRNRRLHVWKDESLVGIDRDNYLFHVQLILHDSIALSLVVRLMTILTDRQNPCTSSALRKIGQTLREFTPHITQHLLSSHRAIGRTGRRRRPFSTLKDLFGG